MTPRYFVLVVGSIMMSCRFNEGHVLLTPWCEKSINASLLYSIEELWDLDQSIIPPSLAIISASIRCVSSKVFAEAVSIALSTYCMLRLTLAGCVGSRVYLHCNIGRGP